MSNPEHIYTYKTLLLLTMNMSYVYNIYVERTRTLYADKRVRIHLPIMVNAIPIPLLQIIATDSLRGFLAHIT